MIRYLWILLFLLASSSSELHSQSKSFKEFLELANEFLIKFKTAIAIKDSNDAIVRKSISEHNKKYTLPDYRPPSPTRPQEAIDLPYRLRALTLLQEENYKGIVKNLKNVSALNDTDRQYLAYAYTKLGNHERSNKYLSEIDSLSFELVLFSTISALLANDCKTAAQNCLNYLNQPNIPSANKLDIHELLGKVYFLNREFKHALEEWKKSIVGKKEIPPFITYFMGVSEFYNLNFEEARKHFLRASENIIQFGSKDSALYLNYYLASMASETGDFSKAREIIVDTDINEESPNPVECDILKKLTFCNFQLVLKELEENEYKKTVYHHLTNAADDLKNIPLNNRELISISVAYILLKGLNEKVNTASSSSLSSNPASEAVYRLLSGLDGEISTNEKALLKFLGFVSYSFFGEMSLSSKIFGKFADQDLIAENNYNCLNQDSFRVSNFAKYFNKSIRAKKSYFGYLLFNYCQFFIKKKDMNQVWKLHYKFESIGKKYQKQKFMYRLLRDHYRSMIEVTSNKAQKKEFAGLAKYYTQKIPQDEKCPGYVLISNEQDDKEFVILLANDYNYRQQASKI
ncbi:tetratricopeptide repeat protein [candidate division KSB1 bacterium]|nr:tetratricopeptide repeat protein [candidate division KSB1 bacterium]